MGSGFAQLSSITTLFEKHLKGRILLFECSALKSSWIFHYFVFTRGTHCSLRAVAGRFQLMMTCKCYALPFFHCLKPYFRILYCHPLLQFLGAFCIKSMPAAKTLEKGTEPLIPLCG